jgi:hypothetical protein
MLHVQLHNSSLWRGCNASKQPYGTRFGCVATVASLSRKHRQRCIRKLRILSISLYSRLLHRGILLCCCVPPPLGRLLGIDRRCCPSGLTEDYFWRHPHEYPSHAPTLLVQSRLDCNSDTDAARYYHTAMRSHGARSTHFVVGGACHGMTPSVFGVVASWIERWVRQ